MRISNYLLIILVLFSSCKRKQQQENLSSTYVTITEYDNQYNFSGELNKIIISNYQIINNEKVLDLVSMKEYFYENDVLRRIEEYDVYPSKALKEERIYGKFTEEVIFHNKPDSGYIFTEEDKKGNIIKYIRKSYQNISDSDIFLNEEYEIICDTDPEGNVIREVYYDYVNDNCIETIFLVNKDSLAFLSLSAVDTRGLAFEKEVHLQIEKIAGDTLITTYLINNQVDKIEKKVQTDKGIFVWIYKDCRLVSTKEDIFHENGDKIFITTSIEDNCVDSIYIKNGKTIRSVYKKPDYIQVSERFFDANGNPLRDIDTFTLK